MTAPIEIAPPNFYSPHPYVAYEPACMQFGVVLVKSDNLAWLLGSRFILRRSFCMFGFTVVEVDECHFKGAEETGTSESRRDCMFCVLRISNRTDRLSIEYFLCSSEHERFICLGNMRQYCISCDIHVHRNGMDRLTDSGSSLFARIFVVLINYVQESRLANQFTETASSSICGNDFGGCALTIVYDLGMR
jgi:hypothetical protein